MLTYCFYCSACGHRVESPFRNPVPMCVHFELPVDLPMVRDYRREHVGVSLAALESRKADWQDVLPTTEDYKGPDDPEGLKGLAKWREEHRPMTPGARHPQESLLRRSFAV